MVLWCWIALDYARLKGAQSQVAFVDYTLCFVFERGEGETDAKFLPYIYLSLNQTSDTMSCLIKPRFFSRLFLFSHDSAILVKRHMLQRSKRPSVNGTRSVLPYSTHVSYSWISLNMDWKSKERRV